MNAGQKADMGPLTVPSGLHFARARERSGFRPDVEKIVVSVMVSYIPDGLQQSPAKTR